MADYRAKTGIDYLSAEDSTPRRAEVGGKISDMTDAAVESELEAGNIEPWSEDGPETTATQQDAGEEAPPSLEKQEPSTEAQ